MANLVGKTLGKHHIIARLGRGGMAEVYKAYQPGLKRYVSIKVLHGYLVDDQTFINRFEREALATGKLRHPNIVQAYDFDRDGDFHFLAMEYIDGPTLKDEINARKESGQLFTLWEVSRIFTALCSAIDYAHQHNMVHRDIKPSNVMISKDGQIVLTDFGIARIIGETQYTQTGAISGTPAYMSPEQGQGQRGDERSDIYALGVMLYEIVTGTIPFDADTPIGIILKHINEPRPPLPTKIDPNVSNPVQNVILKAMNRTPGNRYQTAGDLDTALRKAIGISPDDTLQNQPLITVASPPKVKEIKPFTALPQQQAAAAGYVNQEPPSTDVDATEAWTIQEETPNYSITPPTHPSISNKNRNKFSTATQQQVNPANFNLRRTFRGHEGTIVRIAWSPDGRKIASGSTDHTIHIWDVVTGSPHKILKGEFGNVYGLAWSPDSQLLATSTDDDTIRVWDVTTGRLYQTLKGRSYEMIQISTTLFGLGLGHSGWVRSLAWSPDGKVLASGSRDTTIQLWDVETGMPRQDFKGHAKEIYCLAWSPDGQTLASGAGDKSIRLWNFETGKLQQILTGHTGAVRSVVWSSNGLSLVSGSTDDTLRYWNLNTSQASIIEGHTNHVTGVSISADNRFIASKAADNTVRLWRTDTLESVTILSEPMGGGEWELGLDFHPKASVLATLGEKGRVIRIWKLDFEALLSATPLASSVYYTNAKVVLVGDTSVGKSGLGLVLTGQSFQPTESTHGRQIWVFDSHEVELESERRETRETLLWDLAGQPGYRLIHQLHLSEVTVAIIVFDSRSETDPFAGVRHWDRALRQAWRIQGEAGLPLRKFLVAARMDRGGIGASQARIDALVRDLGFAGYFETSAKEGWQIDQLSEAIHQAIEWQALPRISSTALFQHIKTFLVTEKEAGRLMSTADDLYRAFLKNEETKRSAGNEPPLGIRGLKEQFEVCIGRVESRGLIRRLSFGSLILLQPELLDAYASAIINAAKDEPDGLGSLTEEDARIGRFRMAQDERLVDKAQERLLLIATIEDLLRHEIALREATDAGPLLVFPSQFTREYPNASNPEGRAIIFTFEGPVLNIYTTLAVRLSRSGLFEKEQMWKNAATFRSSAGGICGMFLREPEEGQGELTLFFGAGTNKAVQFQFETYIQVHLQRRALQNSLQRRLAITCDACSFAVTDQLIRLRMERKFDWLNCPVCNAHIALTERSEEIPTTIPTMDQAADIQRERDAAKVSLEGKIATKDFDVFLCYTSADQPAIKQIADRLKEEGILAWLDEWQVQPGLAWQRLLEEQIGHIKSAAVFVGQEGRGPWQQQGLEIILREFLNRNCPVIPVMLPNAPQQPELPIFLKGTSWVDFRRPNSNPMTRLVWGITGDRNRLRQ